MTQFDILNFWFDEIQPEQWWTKSAKFDAEINARFAAVHRRANLCELHDWRQTSKGRLAEIIVLDQFSRNMYRGKSQAFASDPLALALAQEAVAVAADQQLSDAERGFMYLPFMHSESGQIHQTALQLYQAWGAESNLNFEIRHKNIIDQFGRYPHRNEVLGRESTEQELEFLSKPGSSF